MPSGSKAHSIQLISQDRLFYDGKLENWESPVSIVPAPGWTRRESEDFLSVVHINGNVLNIGPAHGPTTGAEENPVEEAEELLAAGKTQGSDIWDSRSFTAHGRPGSYVIHIASNSREYQSPVGEIVGSIGGDVRLGFDGAFHPGATDFREITKMLETVKVEPKKP